MKTGSIRIHISALLGQSSSIRLQFWICAFCSSPLYSTWLYWTLVDNCLTPLLYEFLQLFTVDIYQALLAVTVWLREVGMADFKYRDLKWSSGNPYGDENTMKRLMRSLYLPHNREHYKVQRSLYCESLYHKRETHLPQGQQCQ